MDRKDRTLRDGIPVTTVARTLFDLAEVVDEHSLKCAFEEADRLGLLRLRELEEVCDRRRARRTLRALVEAAREPPRNRSPLENRFAGFCERYRLPSAVTNVLVCGFEVDAFWPAARLVIELDGFSFHRHRAAFERDRVKDAALQVAGYRVIRVTHRRMESEPASIAAEIRSLLRRGSGPGHASPVATTPASRGQRERDSGEKTDTSST